jgi:hypothetical protein
VLTFSTAPQRSHWPKKPEHLNDTIDIRQGDRYFRRSRSATNLLIRKHVCDKQLSAAELEHGCQVPAWLVSALVHGHRDIDSLDEDQLLAIEAALGIEPGRLNALNKAARDHAMRQYQDMIDHEREGELDE